MSSLVSCPQPVVIIPRKLFSCLSSLTDIYSATDESHLLLWCFLGHWYRRSYSSAAKPSTIFWLLWILLPGSNLITLVVLRWLSLLTPEQSGLELNLVSCRDLSLVPSCVFTTQWTFLLYLLNTWWMANSMLMTSKSVYMVLLLFSSLVHLIASLLSVILSWLSAKPIQSKLLQDSTDVVWNQTAPPPNSDICVL